jgi:hypothetical protein
MFANSQLRQPCLHAHARHHWMEATRGCQLRTLSIIVASLTCTCNSWLATARGANDVGRRFPLLLDHSRAHCTASNCTTSRMHLAHTHRHCDICAPFKMMKHKRTLWVKRVMDAQTRIPVWGSCTGWPVNESIHCRCQLNRLWRGARPNAVRKTDAGKKTPAAPASYLHHSKRSNAHLVLVANDERRGVLRNWLRCEMDTGSVDELGNTMLALLSNYELVQVKFAHGVFVCVGS